MLVSICATLTCVSKHTLKCATLTCVSKHTLTCVVSSTWLWVCHVPRCVMLTYLFSLTCVAHISRSCHPHARRHCIDESCRTHSRWRGVIANRALTQCHTLQFTATRCNSLQHIATRSRWRGDTANLTPREWAISLCNTLQYTANHCKTLQHTPQHTLQHTNFGAQRMSNLPLQHTAVHCKSLQHNATHTATHTATH